MTWRHNLHLEGKGSFRGVEFFVDTAESSVGRRTVTHKFPGKDLPMIEDLGKLARRFRLECFVLGDDYFTERDALIREFELGGSGPLVHPYWGNTIVTVDGPVRIRETPKEGGIARISVNVVRSDVEDIQPTVAPDTEQAVNDAADEADDATSEQFQGVEVADDATSTARADQFKRGDIPDEDAWTVFGVIEHVRDQALARAQEITTLLTKVNRYVNAVTNQIDDVEDLVDNFNDQLTDLILTPVELVNEVRGLVSKTLAKVLTYEGVWNRYVTEAERFFNPAATPEASPTAATPDSGGRLNDILKKTFEDFTSFGDDFAAVTGTTPMELIEEGNQNALAVMVQSTSVIEICRTVVQFQFGSFDEAITMRDLLAEYLETLAQTSGDLTYRSLTDLRTAVSRHLTSAAEDLPKLVKYTPKINAPALVIAQQLYGDSRKDVDIITRNNIRNPLIVSGGQELEVLSSG